MPMEKVLSEKNTQDDVSAAKEDAKDNEDIKKKTSLIKKLSLLYTINYLRSWIKMLQKLF